MVALPTFLSLSWLESCYHANRLWGADLEDMPEMTMPKSEIVVAKYQGALLPSQGRCSTSLIPIHCQRQKRKTNLWCAMIHVLWALQHLNVSCMVCKDVGNLVWTMQGDSQNWGLAHSSSAKIQLWLPLNQTIAWTHSGPCWSSGRRPHEVAVYPIEYWFSCCS